jgi:hypothetical protein
MSEKTAFSEKKTPQTVGLKTPSLKLSKAILSTDPGKRQLWTRQ